MNWKTLLGIKSIIILLFCVIIGIGIYISLINKDYFRVSFGIALLCLNIWFMYREYKLDKLEENEGLMG